MENLVKVPLSEVPVEWLAVLEECSKNFKTRWDSLIGARRQAEVTGDRYRLDEIDAEISRMMVVNDGEVGDENVVARIFGGPNGFGIFSEDFLRTFPLKPQ